jgi:serpin B
MSRNVLLAIPAAVMGLAQGCGGDPAVNPIAVNPIEERRIPEALRGDVAEVARSSNRFAFDLYRDLAGDGSENLFFSPYSITTALSMTMAGAAGRTEGEMAVVLHLNLPGEQLHPACGALVASLDRGSQFSGYRLDIANGLWAQQGFPFLEEFLSIPRNEYGAEVGQFDFASEADAARRSINEWVAGKTADRIRDLFPPGTITDLTRLVLANAIYFKGNWDRRFDPDRTQEGDFYVGDGRSVRAPMMHQHGEFAYAEVEEVQILEMPYVGRDLSMIVLLPERDGLARLEERLDASTLLEWLPPRRETELYVSFPKFRVTAAYVLNQVLAGMGMPSAFDPDLADFSAMIGTKGLFIQTVVHQGFVEVNEVGTEAAAATGVGSGLTSAPPEFRADRAFVYLIRDNVTETILFLGRLVDPTA